MPVCMNGGSLSIYNNQSVQFTLIMNGDIKIIIEPGKGIKRYWNDMWHYREIKIFVGISSPYEEPENQHWMLVNSQ